MRRVVVVGAMGTAIVAGSLLVGCSSDRSSSGKGSSPSGTAESALSSPASAITSATAAAKGNPPPGQAEVTVADAKQDIAGTVVCTNAAGNFNIAIGEGTSGVAVVMSVDAATVHSVGLGNVNGVILGFQEGISGGEAAASKDGNTYIIKGTATGITAAVPPAPVNKSFEITVTCP